MNRKLFLILALSLLAGSLPIATVVSPTEAAPTPETQARMFIEAIQKQDFKRIFDMTFYYQTELSQMKASNPKALWEKLTAEYYESKKSGVMSRQAESLTDAWARFGGALFNTPTDPSADICALMGLLIPSCSWRVSETRAQKQLDQWTGRQRDITVVYITISYPTVGKSVIVGNQVLKEVILAFNFDKASGLYLKNARVPKGDVYWHGTPDIDAEVGQKFFLNGQYKIAIDRLRLLHQKGTLNRLGENTLALALFERVTREGFPRFGGGYYGPNPYSSYDWKADVEEAIQLDSSIRQRWIDFLVPLMTRNANSAFGRFSGGDQAVIKVALTATEFGRGFPDLESKVRPHVHDLAKIFIERARGYQTGGGTYFIERDLKAALTLGPEDEDIRKLCVEAIDHLIERARREVPAYADSNVRQLREAGKSLGLAGF